MVDLELVTDRLSRLQGYLKILKQLQRFSREALLEDPLALGSAERYLHVSIEACLDIANHIIATERMRSPSGYADVFTILAENDVIPADFLPNLQNMARFRNRLVHLYWELEAETIYRILKSYLNDFTRFQEYILKYIEREE